MVCILTGDDGSHQRRSSNTVAENIRRPFRLDYGSVVVLGGIDMHVMFIYQKGLRDDGQTLIGFDRKLLVTVRKEPVQFLFV